MRRISPLISLTLNANRNQGGIIVNVRMVIIKTIRHQIYERLKSCCFKYLYRKFRSLKRPRFLFELSDPKVGIGNIINVTPAIIAIKALYPNSLIDIKLKYIDLLQGWKTIDNLYDDSNRKDDRYDFIFTHGYGEESYKINSLKLNVVADKNEACNHFKKIQLMGYVGEMPKPYVSNKPVDIHFPKDRLKIGVVDCGKNKGFGLKGESKSWPYYDELIRILLENYRCQIYLIGGPYEKGKIKITDKHVIDCMGRYALPETAYILKNCDIAVGNDCGPMRIADTVGVKHYVIWGPTSPIKNGYLNNYFYIYNKEITCRPCQGKDKKEKCEHLACLYGIKTTDVISSIEELKKYKCIQ